MHERVIKGHLLTFKGAAMMADRHLQSGGQFIYDAQISTLDLNAIKISFLTDIIY